jgi:hypothetical protein
MCVYTGVLSTSQQVGITVIGESMSRRPSTKKRPSIKAVGGGGVHAGKSGDNLPPGALVLGASMLERDTSFSEKVGANKAQAPAHVAAFPSVPGGVNMDKLFQMVQQNHEMLLALTKESESKNPHRDHPHSRDHRAESGDSFSRSRDHQAESSSSFYETIKAPQNFQI